MDKVIADTYELIEKLGSGGGGNVYLANHKRLNKLVVLKADKRKITTKPEILRREVDVLKELKNDYIPSVLDFFIENDTAYTAMDYIEGESLDKPLKRGEKFSQPQVIHWAKQLLSALSYLHNPDPSKNAKGYVHSDIKPANIMRKPNNDICLIDFNIALALGEESVIGCTAGYASPEHYGLDYSSSGSGTVTIGDAVTETLIDETSTLTLTEQGSRKTGKKIVPDVRSDIYSVGATLYHLLSGDRPAKNAMEVIPLSERDFSPSIVKIISKAMNPNPDLRYQTADEMLRDFVNLRRNDPRVKRQKRAKKYLAFVTPFILLIGALFVFVGLKRMQTTERWLKLAEYSSNALLSGDREAAIKYALDAIPRSRSILVPTPIPQAQKALTDALAVYDLADSFKLSRTLELPSAPLFIALSPEGKTVACIYAYSLDIYDANDGTKIVSLPVSESALSEVVYIDENNILYAGKDGITKYDINTQEILWKGAAATSLSLSGDKGSVAAVYRDETVATIYDVQSGEIRSTVDFNGRHQHVVYNDTFANPNNNLLALNEDGTLLGVSFEDGSLEVFNLSDREKDLILFEPGSGYIHFEGGFFKQYFAFSAYSANEGGLFAVIDTIEERQTGGFHSKSSFGVQTDTAGIYVQTGHILVNIDPVSGEQIPLVNATEDIRRFARTSNQVLVSSGNSYFFFDEKADMVSCGENDFRCDFLQISNGTALVASMDSPNVRVLSFDSNMDANVLSYEASYKHNEARVNSDKTTVMLFSYKQFRLYDMSGKLIKDCSLPDAEHVYDQQYRRDGAGSRLEVTYYDGHMDVYSAETGELLRSVDVPMPGTDLTEEFSTDNYRIVAPLHGAPEVYDIRTGAHLFDLKENAYLTYVTQVGEQIVVQYITADGYVYGQLLDENCELLADLPYLCDIYNGILYFDCPSGNIRESRIFNIDELIKLAE